MAARSAFAEAQPRPASRRRRHADLLGSVLATAAISRRRPSSRRSAPAPTRSAASSRGASSSSSACRITGARICPVNVGLNNFDRIRYEYFRDRTRRLRGLQERHAQLPRGIHLADLGDRLRLSRPSARAGSSARRSRTTRRRPIQGWYFNLRREQFKDPRIREAIGLAFDFEWTNQNIMFGLYKRTTSFFENSDMKAKGPPSAEELALLEPFRGKVPDAVFGEPYVPPVSDGSGQDRQLLRRADELLREAGCKREGSVPEAAERQALRDRVPRLPGRAAAAHAALPGESEAPRHRRALAHRRRGAVSAPHGRVRLRHGEPRALAASPTPGDSLRVVFGSQAAQDPGSRNIAGIADPAVDALIERIAQAKTREDLDIACRALDRVLRAGRYWVPMWFKATDWLAYWDMFSRPAVKPKLQFRRARDLVVRRREGTPHRQGLSR